MCLAFLSDEPNPTNPTPQVNILSKVSFIIIDSNSTI